VRASDRRVFKESGLDFFAARLLVAAEGHNQIRVTFTAAVPFGLFCVALKGHNVAFLLAGSRTVILSAQDFKNLPRAAGEILQDGRAKGVISIAPVDSRPRQVIRSEEETEDLLRKFAKAL